ncbi:cobalt transporter CbiM [Dethiosulfatarculus sandiegensis]|uniref:Cobalt transporter CbiM n=1 Tax=Dethiosulfatarculus sandiegensis TaxID=1429043 RepID=A0A0D2GFI8_9BACT|nr:cobalt transporter CbiM [Dethiosulfatarculus sandiegensis]KIX13707.1 cobalt transporter CbiM [Dethiosulfatarculus sandiegensis]
MHISEGALSVPVLTAGAVLTAFGVAKGLKKLDQASLPQTAILSAVFFVGSLVHVPLGPSSIHLLLGGLMGVILGWICFPALLVALFLQAILFQFGGLLVLGVNTFDVAFPALLCYWAFGKMVQSPKQSLVIVGGFLAGGVSVFLTALTTALALYLSGEEFLLAAQGLVLGHLPLVLVEGVFTGFAAAFLRKVRPEVLGVTSI